jgi:hypothetical protein
VAPLATPAAILYPRAGTDQLREQVKRWHSLFLVMALLFAQAALLEHEYDFAAHKSGDTCVTCLHATPLSHAATGASLPALPVAATGSEFQPAASRAVAGGSVAYRARAPPFPSFA